MADLAQRIDAELENIDGVLERLPPAASLPDLSELELAGVVALVHSFYNGVENIIKQVARARRLPLPTGEAWHRDLIESVYRAGIISEETWTGIKEFLAFRHFFAHAYAFDTDPERLEPLVAKLPACYRAFRKDLEKLRAGRMKDEPNS